jgi:hypothetical protein
MTGHDERDDYDDEGWGDQLAPAPVVHWPASAMWGFGVLQLILLQTWTAFVVALLVISHFVDDDRTLAELWRTITSSELVWMSLVGWPLATACAVVVIRGANDLGRFRHYWWAVTAAFLTLFSAPVVCLAPIQLPLGVWVLVVLARRDVRARFETVARHRTGGDDVTAC